MRLVFHGKLRDLYGESVDMVTNVPANAIEGFFSQQPEHPRDMLIEAVGYNTDLLLHAETDAEEVHLIPAMFGGGGNFGKILLGGALIAGAIFIPGVGAALGGFLKSTMIAMGASMALQGVMGLFFKSPVNSKEGDPEPSRYLGTNQNTTAQGTPITIACGRINIAGHWLSLQSDADKLVTGTFPESVT